MSDVLNAERARYLIGLIGNTCMAEPDTAAVASSALSELGEIFADAEARVVAAERERDAAVEAGKEALLTQVADNVAASAAVRAGGNAAALAEALRPFTDVATCLDDDCTNHRCVANKVLATHDAAREALASLEPDGEQTP